MHPSGYQGSRFNTNKIAPPYGEATLLVETQGLEPWTPALQRQCSSQLSYVPYLVGDEGLEPPTSSLSVTRSNQLS